MTREQMKQARRRDLILLAIVALVCIVTTVAVELVMPGVW
jgi:hypothetical protein